MNKYAVCQCVNGNFTISTEHSSMESAIIAFHNLCAALWNADDVITATIDILDENLEVLNPPYIRYIERIDKRQESNE